MTLTLARERAPDQSLLASSSAFMACRTWSIATATASARTRSRTNPRGRRSRVSGDQVGHLSRLRDRSGLRVVAKPQSVVGIEPKVVRPKIRRRPIIREQLARKNWIVLKVA